MSPPSCARPGGPGRVAEELVQRAIARLPREGATRAPKDHELTKLRALALEGR